MRRPTSSIHAPAALSFLDAITHARQRQEPLLAFNIVDLASAGGVLEAAALMERPVILQISARTLQFYGAEVICAAARNSARRLAATCYIHLDHCSDDSVLHDALEARFDGIMADGSHKSYEDNRNWTADWVQRAHKFGMLVEGEIGSIQGSEDGFVGIVRDQVVDHDLYLRFGHESGVDLLGTDIGTAHGRYARPPNVNIDFVRKVEGRSAPGFVVHGASGLQTSVLRELVAAGTAKVNFSTDLKYAWFDGIAEHSSDIQREPLVALASASNHVRQMAMDKWSQCTFTG